MNWRNRPPPPPPTISETPMSESIGSSLLPIYDYSSIANSVEEFLLKSSKPESYSDLLPNGTTLSYNESYSFTNNGPISPSCQSASVDSGRRGGRRSRRRDAASNDSVRDFGSQRERIRLRTERKPMTEEYARPAETRTSGKVGDLNQRQQIMNMSLKRALYQPRLFPLIERRSPKKAHRNVVDAENRENRRASLLENAFMEQPKRFKLNRAAEPTSNYRSQGRGISTFGQRLTNRLSVLQTESVMGEEYEGECRVAEERHPPALSFMFPDSTKGVVWCYGAAWWLGRRCCIVEVDFQFGVELTNPLARDFRLASCRYMSQSNHNYPWQQCIHGEKTCLHNFSKAKFVETVPERTAMKWMNEERITRTEPISTTRRIAKAAIKPVTWLRTARQSEVDPWKAAHRRTFRILRLDGSNPECFLKLLAPTGDWGGDFNDVYGVEQEDDYATKWKNPSRDKDSGRYDRVNDMVFPASAVLKSAWNYQTSTIILKLKVRWSRPKEKLQPKHFQRSKLLRDYLSRVQVAQLEKHPELRHSDRTTRRQSTGRIWRLNTTPTNDTTKSQNEGDSTLYNFKDVIGNAASVGRERLLTRLALEAMQTNNAHDESEVFVRLRGVSSWFMEAIRVCMREIEQQTELNYNVRDDDG